MKRQYLEDDYSSVVRSRSRRAEENVVAEPKRIIAVSKTPIPPPVLDQSVNDNATFLRGGHAVSFALLFLFTVVLYARPAEFYPSAITNSLALIIGVILLATFAATQIALEGSLTARPPEVNLLLLFTLTAALSIPLAIDPLIAWHEFSGTFIRANEGAAEFVPGNQRINGERNRQRCRQREEQREVDFRRPGRKRSFECDLRRGKCRKQNDANDQCQRISYCRRVKLGGTRVEHDGEEKQQRERNCMATSEKRRIIVNRLIENWRRDWRLGNGNNSLRLCNNVLFRSPRTRANNRTVVILEVLPLHVRHSEKKEAQAGPRFSKKFISMVADDLLTRHCLTEI